MTGNGEREGEGAQRCIPSQGRPNHRQSSQFRVSQPCIIYPCSLHAFLRCNPPPFCCSIPVPSMPATLHSGEPLHLLRYLPFIISMLYNPFSLPQACGGIASKGPVTPHFHMSNNFANLD